LFTVSQSSVVALCRRSVVLCISRTRVLALEIIMPRILINRKQKCCRNVHGGREVLSDTATNALYRRKSKSPFVSALTVHRLHNAIHAGYPERSPQHTSGSTIVPRSKAAPAIYTRRAVSSYRLLRDASSRGTMRGMSKGAEVTIYVSSNQQWRCLPWTR
jgi:hypothetical protein